MKAAWNAGFVLAALGLSSGFDMAAAQNPNRTDVRVDSSLRYDSNVARSDDATAALRGIQPEDEIFTPGVSVDVARVLGGQSVFLQGALSYNFYAHNSKLNRERLVLDTGVNSQ